MMDPVFRSNPLGNWQSAYQPPPLLSSPRLSSSLIFLTWVMAFVIPNDSRNKSTVMRSHWVLFFFFFFLWNHPSQLRTVNLFLRLRLGPGSELQWASVKQINSFLGKTFLQPKWTPCPSEHVCFFPISKTYYFLTHWSSYPGLMLMLPATFPNSALWHP